MDQLNWLAKKEELEFSKNKFSGKLSAKTYQYSTHLDGVIRTRAIIFAMAVLTFYPVLMRLGLGGEFIYEMLIERIIFSCIFIISGLLFNKLRVISIIISVLLLLIIALAPLLFMGVINIYGIGFNLGISLILLLGLYHHFKMKKLETELKANLLENQLIE